MKVGCRIKSNYPLVRPGPVGGVLSMRVFLRDPSPYLREFWRKARGRLGRQARRGIEPGTSRVPVLSAEPLRH